MNNKIGFYRAKLGLTQAEFAKKFGWYQSRIGTYETGEQYPPIPKAIQIVQKFNELGIKCTLDDLFPYELNTPTTTKKEML